MRHRIEHRIGVAAPASAAWAVLADMDRWCEWNPVYKHASGRLAIGETIRFQVEIEGEAPVELAGVVIDWVPEAQLVLRIKAMHGLLTVTRYLEIEALSERGCILANGEIQEGPAARFVSRRLRMAIRRGFEQMNTAAKARAEQRWDGVPDPPLVSVAPPPPPRPNPKMARPGR